jgi:hypothetical protein
MPESFNKHQRQRLRELATLAYEKEMAQALSELEQAFRRWCKQEIGVFDLDHEIHKYHNGVARDLYKKYNYGGKPDLLVAVAVCDGVLAREDLGEDLFSRLSASITSIQESKNLTRNDGTRNGEI